MIRNKKNSITEEWFFKGLMMLSTALIIFALALILYSILIKGIPSLTWSMIVQTPGGGFYFGKEGGILNAIAGSVYLALGATFLAFCISLPAALLMNIHLAKYKTSVNSIRFFLDLLWGIPSIVYGAFGFMIMVYFGLRMSLLSGIITVALLIIPIMIRGMDEVLKTVPRGLMESSFSLGATRSETAYRVFFRQAMAGIITAILLAFGRAIGDAASVLFTAGYTDNVPTSLTQQAATLPLSIFFQLSSPIEEVRNRAYASALVLTLLVLLISILARILSGKYSKTKINF